MGKNLNRQFSKEHMFDQHVPEKMINIASHQGNTNQKCN